MSKDSDFLDSLLEDLENIVTIKERNPSSSSFSSSLNQNNNNNNEMKSKYIPHPPPDIPSMVTRTISSFFSLFSASLLLYFISFFSSFLC